MIDWHFNIDWYIISLAISLIVYMKLNINHYIRSWFKLNRTKHYPILSCFPCFSFWLTLAITFNPTIALSVFVSAFLIEKI